MTDSQFKPERIETILRPIPNCEKDLSQNASIIEKVDGDGTRWVPAREEIKFYCFFGDRPITIDARNWTVEGCVGCQFNKPNPERIR